MHISPAHEELLRVRLLAVAPPKEDPEQRGEDEEQSEHKVVGPVERQRRIRHLGSKAAQLYDSDYRRRNAKEADYASLCRL